MSAILPRGFDVGGSVQVRSTDYEGNRRPFTDGPREDLTRTLSISVFKRDFTLYGFAPQSVVTHSAQERRSDRRETLPPAAHRMSVPVAGKSMEIGKVAG